MMAHSQLIHEYVDGSLAPYLEEILFNELSRSESLRHEFRSQLALQQAASADARQIIVPNEARQELFSMLGLKPSTPQPLAQTASKALHLRVHVLTSLLCFSFALGLLGYHMALRSSDSAFMFDRRPIGSESVRNIATTTQSSALTDKTVQTAPDGWSVADASIEKSHSTINNMPARAVSPAAWISTDNSDTNQDIVQSQHIQSFNVYSSTLSTPLPAIVAERPLQSVAAPTVSVAPFFLDQPFRIEVRGTRSLVAAQNSTSLLSNTAINFMYEINSDECLGMEVNNDTYGVTQSQKIAGVTVVREQNLSHPSLGVVYRRKVQEFEDLNLGCYAQGVCGASISGNMYARAAVGVDWHPEGRLFLALALSAATLNYSSDNTRRFAWTPGIQYSVGFHF